MDDGPNGLSLDPPPAAAAPSSDGPASTPPTWRRIALPAGAVILGLGFIIALAAVGSGLSDRDPALTPSHTPAPTTGSEPPSAGPSAATATSEASVGPPATPPTSSSASFNLLPGQPPANFEGQITCAETIGPSDPVALAWLVAGDPSVPQSFVLRDYADIGQPRTACTFVNVQVEQLIDARHIVIAAGGVHAVVDLPEVRYQWFQLPPWSAESGSMFIAVSPRLDQIVWLTWRVGEVGTSVLREIHVTTASGDTVVASLPDEPTGFCGAPLDYSKPGAYSLSGDYLYVIDQPRDAGGGGGLNYSLRVFAGSTTVFSLAPPAGGWPSGGHPAMPVWSPTSDTLYYRQGDDVWRWTPDEGASMFLAGVRWATPTITPDGSHLVYAVQGDVYLAELASPRNPDLIGQGASRPPVFLNDEQLWLFGTLADHGCAGSEGAPSIYNITDGSESPSIIDQVRGVWPATSSIY